MAQKLNIYAEEWCDLVFEGKNQTYGAFVLRKFRDKRHRIAIIATFTFFILAFSIPTLLSIIAPHGRTRNVDVTMLSDINLEKTKEPPKLEKPPEEIKASIKFTPPVIAPDEQVKEEMKSQDQLSESKDAISIADIKGGTEGTDISEVTKKVVEPDEDKPLLVVEQNPEFSGGYAAMQKFLTDHIQYPTLAQESAIQGTVFISFVVSKTGKISNVKVLRGIGGGCDEEAVRVVKEMPNWIPGRQNGQAVPVQFQIPVKFQLNTN
jgi:protein TonB